MESQEGYSIHNSITSIISYILRQILAIFPGGEEPKYVLKQPIIDRNQESDVQGAVLQSIDNMGVSPVALDCLYLVKSIIQIYKIN
jgi:hypothetical protein